MFKSNLLIKSGIIAFSFLLSIAIYYGVINQALTGDLRNLRLVQLYGIISIIYLFAVMLAGPLYRLYPELPFKTLYRQSLGGLGISTFYFAFLHSYLGFFITLHGFVGLPFLDNIYLISIVLGFVGLLILAAMAGTSFTFAMRALGKHWKTIHRFIYLGGIAIVVHTILIGSDFRNLLSPLPLICVFGFLLIVILQTISTYRYLLIRFPNVASRLWSASLSIVLIGGTYLLFILHEYIVGGHHH